VVWPRFPPLLRSRIIEYVWDSGAPVGTIAKNQKTGRSRSSSWSGRAELGQWLTERRNVAEDYERGFGEAPANPAAIAISIDSDDTHPMAESFLGVSQFR
jgi:Protein of unknown function (DUF3047)